MCLAVVQFEYIQIPEGNWSISRLIIVLYVENQFPERDVQVRSFMPTLLLAL